jgi:hypothetical protein
MPVNFEQFKGMAFRDPRSNPILRECAAIARRYGSRLEARKLKGFVDKLEDVDQKYRDLYVEETVGDKTRYRLDADGVEDVSGLKTTVATLRRENDTLKKKVKPLEELETEGLDLEEVVDAGRVAVEAKKTGKQTPEVETAVKLAVKKKDTEIARLTNETTGLMEALRTAVYDGVIDAAIKDEDGISKILKPHIKAMIDIVKVTDGDKVRYESRVMEGEGSARTERLGTDGKPFPIRAAVAELRGDDDFEGAFLSRVVPGSGTPADGGSGTPTPPKNRGTREQPNTGGVAVERKNAKLATQDYSL